MKKSIISNKRLVAGLIGLLFVVTFVHTISILNISNNLTFSKINNSSQKAQVGTFNCLQVSPMYNIVEPSEVYYNGTYPGVSNHMYLNIKNICSSTINIFNPGIGYTIPTLIEDQTRQVNGTPLTILNSQLSNYNINSYTEFLECFNCGNTIAQYPSTVTGTPSTVYVHPIAPQQTRTIIYNINYSMTSISEWPIRIAPKAIKWVAQNSLADNQISNSDISTVTLTSTQRASWATDFLEPYYQ